MPQVVCAGHVNWDITLRVDHLPAPDEEAAIEAETGTGGGSAANVATALVGLDVETVLLGSVAPDERGANVRAELRDVGVDCSPLVTTEGETAVKYLVVDPDGDLLVFGRNGVNEAFSADDLPTETLADTDHLHLTSQTPETAATLADRAANHDVTVSFDPGRRVGDRNFDAVFSRADLVFLNDREAATALAGDHVLAERTVVLKHGPRGAEVRTPTTTHTHAGFDVESVDTTGAGDAFAAGFLAARLDEADEARALAIANACGALATRTTGARTALSWANVEAMLDAARPT